MTLATPIPLKDQQHCVLDGASWELYESLLADPACQNLRITYDNGELEMMAPLPVHEVWKKVISRLIESMAMDLPVRVVPWGSTTFRRKDLGKGLEPDDCYCVQNAKAVIGKTEFDSAVDPPPDMAIEIDITHRSVPREPIYAALGIRELWRFNGRKLQVLILDADCKHQPVDSSSAFPFLPISKFEQFVFRLAEGDPLEVFPAFRAWLATLPKP